MGYSWQQADDWDFVPYSATLATWNARNKEENGDTEETTIESEPPPIEWMIEDDIRAHARGYKVH